MMSKRKNVIIKADSLAEAYAMAFDEMGPEFDVLEIKKVSSGAFGATNIEIKVASVEKKSDLIQEVKLDQIDKTAITKRDLKPNLELVINEASKTEQINKKEQRGATKKERGNNIVSWSDIVINLRTLGFKESLIVKILSEIKTTGKHLKLDPYALVEDRLVYYCVNETSNKKQINVLFAKDSFENERGVSAYLFSHYAKQSLSSKKIVLTNSVNKLKNMLDKDFLNILKVELIELVSAQDWLSSSSEILSQDEVCCVYFQHGELEKPNVPDAMGTVRYTKLVNWSEDLNSNEQDFLKNCRAQFFVMGKESNSIGSLLKPSLKFEIPTSFVLRGNDFLTGLASSSDLVKKVNESISSGSLVKEHKAG